MISLIPSDTAKVVSKEILYFKSLGNFLLSSSTTFLMLAATSKALDPGICLMLMVVAGLPFMRASTA